MEPVRHRISFAGRFLVTSLPGFAPTASHHERRIMSRQGADTSIADVSRIQQNVRFESESGQIASQGRCHATLLDESIATAGAPDNQASHRVLQKWPISGRARHPYELPAQQVRQPGEVGGEISVRSL